MEIRGDIMALLVGLSGKKQSGKSTLAKYLEEKHAFFEYGWADPLKQIIGMDLMGLTVDQVYGSNKDKETIDAFWGKSPRQLLQIIGTECFRKQVDPDFWVKVGVRQFTNFRDRNIVVPDCRFPNEIEAIKNEGGIVIRVVREDWTVKDEHESETALDNYDFEHIVTAKTGEIESLQLQTELILSKYAISSK